MAFNKTPPLTIWTIAGGVMIGTLAAHAIEVGGAALLLRIELAKMNYRMEQAAEQNRKDIAQRNVAIQAQKEAMDKQREAQNAARQQAERDRIAAEAKRAEAWANFYTVPSKCKTATNDQTFMECANEHAKALTAFEKQYKPSSPPTTPPVPH